MYPGNSIGFETGPYLCRYALDCIHQEPKLMPIISAARNRLSVKHGLDGKARLWRTKQLESYLKNIFLVKDSFLSALRSSKVRSL